MDKFRNYDVAFSGLKTGKHEFKFEVEQAFFDLFETEQEFSGAKIDVDVLLEKHSTFLDFLIKIHGTVNLVCDITSETFTHPIENEIKFLVKFGEEYDDSNEEVITIPQGDSAFNISQASYEAVILSIPMKKISPNVKEEDFELIEKFSPKEIEEEEKTNEIDPRQKAKKKIKDKKQKTNKKIKKEETHEIDPRWEALKKLKDKKQKSYIKFKELQNGTS